VPPTSACYEVKSSHIKKDVRKDFNAPARSPTTLTPCLRDKFPFPIPGLNQFPRELPAFSPVLLLKPSV